MSVKISALQEKKKWMVFLQFIATHGFSSGRLDVNVLHAFLEFVGFAFL